jgi:hypothetical protein
VDDALLAEIVLIAHFAYAGFVVSGFVAIPLGGALGWGWVRNRAFRLLHLAAIAFVGFEGVIGMVCPLTEWEYRLRLQAGLQAEEGAFIGRIVSSLLYYDFPPWVFTTAYLLLTALAIALLFWVPPRPRTRSY